MKKMFLSLVLSCFVGILNAENAQTEAHLSASGANGISGAGVNLNSLGENEFLIAEDAFVRATPPNAKNSAVFLKLTNHGSENAVLIGATSSISKNAELHAIKKEGAKMSMQRLDEVAIKPHATHEFKPGADHIMLIGLLKPLKEGESIDLTLIFKDGSKLSLKNIAAKPVMMAH